MIKRGEQPILTELERSGIGLRVNIRTHPVIEEFMRASLGTKEPTIEPVESFGRIWEPARGESKKELLVYGIPKELTGVFTVMGGTMYRMDRPGQPIFVDNRDRGGPPSPDDDPRRSGSRTLGYDRVLNLSFLRLVGSSESGGVTFHLGGIYGEDILEALDRQLTAATREIYSQFMKPIKITVVLEAQEDIATRERRIEVDAGGDPAPPLIVDAAGRGLV